MSSVSSAGCSATRRAYLPSRHAGWLQRREEGQRTSKNTLAFLATWRFIASRPTRSCPCATLPTHFLPEARPMTTLEANRVTVEEGVVYGSAGDRELRCDIYHPPAAVAKDVGVLLVHGGGWSSGDRSQLKGYGILL